MAETSDKDAGMTTLDGGVGLPSHPLIRQYVAHVITNNYEGCEKLDPADLPIPEGIADQIMFILNGNGCKPIFVAEGIDADCVLPPEIIEVKSNIRFKGLLVVFKDSAFQLEEGGQIYYEAFNELCGRFPDIKVKIVGIELRPEREQSPVPVLAGTEVAEDGSVLVRIHVFDGEVTARYEGERLLQMFKAWEVWINAKTKEVEGVSSPETGDHQDGDARFSQVVEAQKEDLPQVRAETGTPTGCNVPGGATAPSADLLMTAMAFFALLKGLKGLQK